MIRSFRTQGAEDVYYHRDTKDARRTCPNTLWRVAGHKMDRIDNVVQVADLRVPPGNRCEALSGDRAGQYGIRLNDQYRICFRWDEGGAEDVEIVDYH